ncbi:AEC family transporter [Thiotrichales bacterium 19X7-9]|nr:AEC family transporter [Thiotrichales bacterium 19X7-9]
MLSVFSTTFVLFFTIFLGMILGKTRIFNQGADQVLIRFVFYIALPMHLFLNCYQKSSLDSFDFDYTLSYVVSMILLIGLTFILSKKIIKTSTPASVLNTMAVTQIDGAYFVIPLFMLIFSSDVMVIPLMAVQNIIFFTFTILMIELTKSNNQQENSSLNNAKFVLKRIIKVITTNPIIVSSLLGFILGATKVPLEYHIVKAFEFVGNTSPAVALFSLGLSCAYGLSNVKVFKDKLPVVLFLSTLKLILFPLIALIVGMLFGLNHQFLFALVLFTASPTATHNYIVANQYALEPEAQTFVVILTTILSFISINIWLFLFL